MCKSTSRSKLQDVELLNKKNKNNEENEENEENEDYSSDSNQFQQKYQYQTLSGRQQTYSSQSQNKQSNPQTNVFSMSTADRTDNDQGSTVQNHI